MTRVAIVGAGVMGSAAALALAERSADVTVLEQFAEDRVRGSSHGRSRIIRLAYSDPEYVALAREAYEGWRSLERRANETLIELHGFLEVAPTLELTSAATLAAHGIEHRVLSAAEASELGAAVPADWATLHQQEAGIIRADRARRALFAAARAAGVRVEWGRRVQSVDEVDADVVVVAAGPWVRTFIPDLPVRTTCETVVYFRHGRIRPAIVDLNPASGGHALYSLHDPVHGLKAGVHHAGREADPDGENEPDPALVERTIAWVRERLPEVDPEPVELDTCFYTTTRDESFVLERRGRVVLCSACSGHGFKFAPAIGTRVADLALATS